jgi:hypothetical protein
LDLDLDLDPDLDPDLNPELESKPKPQPDLGMDLASHKSKIIKSNIFLKILKNILRFFISQPIAYT